MSAPERGPPDTTRAALELFAEAAGRAARSIRAAARAEGVGEDEVRACIDRIEHAVATRIREPATEPEHASLRSEPVFDPFLDAVFRDVLDRARDGPPAAESALRVMGAIASMRRPGPGPCDALEQEDLRARLRAPDAFTLLVDVAHDFRSPLTSILFLAETLRDGHSGEVTDLQRSQLGLVYSAAFGLAAVAADVVDLARRETDLVEGEAQLYRIDEIFDSVYRLVLPIAEEKALDLRIEIGPDLTSAHGHPHALSRVLLNLTTNALKYTDAGTVEMGVGTLPHGMLQFYVQDTGRGIPADRMPELFRPFKRRLGDGQQGFFFSGSGVGLSIARRLVTAMGSELELATSDERGTRFTFQLPGSRPPLR